MKENNISQSGDYAAPFCEQQYTNGSCYISLFKLKSFDQSIPPQTASKFRHLLSCGTIGTGCVTFLYTTHLRRKMEVLVTPT